MNDVLDFDAAALAEKFRRRELSPVAVTEAYLTRIEDIGEQVNAYITVAADAARTAAGEAEREIVAGRWRGPFHGIPVALKDLCYTRGILTTGGSKILADFVPDHDSTVWARLKNQGAVLLGKLNLHEFAYGVTSTNPHWGAVHNPYNLLHIPGGSSGGSAAATLRGLGAVVEEVSAPALDGAIATAAIISAEAFEFHESWLRQRPDDYGEDVRERLRAAATVMAPEYVRAQRARAAMLADALEALAGRDVLLAPVSSIP